MKYKILGRTGVKVSELCYGTMAFGGDADEKTSEQMYRRVRELGFNFFDTANVYSQGRSEKILGKLIQGERDELGISSKGCGSMGDGPNDSGLSRRHIMQAVEASLARLQTDRLDLYFVHNFDGDTPIEETLSALDDLVRQGKGRYVGACNWTAAQVVEALWTADHTGLDPLYVLQNQYNILNRWEIEPELVPLCRQYGLGMMTFSPLAVGLLTGRFRRGQTPPEGTHLSGNERFAQALDEKNDRIVQALIDIGRAQGKTPAQVAIAWILANGGVTAPIIGPDLPEHVEEVVGALDVELGAEDLQVLDQLSQWESLQRTH